MNNKTYYSSNNITSYNKTSTNDEALSALVMLGFGKAQVEKVLTSLVQTNEGLSVEDLIKQALKKL